MGLHNTWERTSPPFPRRTKGQWYGKGPDHRVAAAGNDRQRDSLDRLVATKKSVEQRGGRFAVVDLFAERTATGRGQRTRDTRPADADTGPRRAPGDRKGQTVVGEPALGEGGATRVVRGVVREACAERVRSERMERSKAKNGRVRQEMEW